MAGFLHRTRYARPFVTLKTATSMDGRIALADGGMRWITGPQMRRFVHLQRSRCDAIMTGIGTVLADDPELTCRLDDAADDHPYRFVLDSHLQTPLDSRLLETVPQAGLTLFCGTEADSDRANSFRDAGAMVQPVAADDHGRLGLDDVMAMIAAAGKGHLLVEAGGKLAASLLQADLVDRILWTQSSQVIGDDGIGAISKLGLTNLPDTSRFAVTDEGHFGADRFILMERPARSG
jgi:diaminohydroxyphosphoribosylaminopyrimidine deaminase/5-amino-6-(5-phosphoribosylamino)uracil reductase